MENDFGSNYTVMSCTGGRRNQSSQTAKHITFITSCHANILPETCYVTPWALSPTYSIIIEWTPMGFTLYDKAPQWRVATKHTRGQLGDGGGTTKLKWLEFQYKSTTKKNLEKKLDQRKLCGRTRTSFNGRENMCIPVGVKPVNRRKLTRRLTNCATPTGLNKNTSFRANGETSNLTNILWVS